MWWDSGQQFTSWSPLSGGEHSVVLLVSVRTHVIDVARVSIQTKNKFWPARLQPRIWGIGRPGRNVGYVTQYKRVYGSRRSWPGPVSHRISICGWIRAVWPSLTAKETVTGVHRSTAVKLVSGWIVCFLKAERCFDLTIIKQTCQNISNLYFTDSHRWCFNHLFHRNILSCEPTLNCLTRLGECILTVFVLD